MKIVQVTTKSKGGAGIAALRLHNALQKEGISSAYLSTDLTIGFDNKERSDEFFTYKKPSLLKRIVLRLGSVFNPSVLHRSQKVLRSMKGQLQYEMLSLPYSQFRLEDHQLIKDADIINLHWVGGILDYMTFFKKIDKPIVWTLHDMNPFLGLFHYKDDENRNVNQIFQLNESINKIKKRSYQEIKKGAIVSPSNWLLNEAESSNMFSQLSFKECIPNSIDFNEFTILDKRELRKELSISKSDFVMLFISGELHCERKGLDLLLDALHDLDLTNVTVITVGDGNIRSPNSSIKVIPLGKIDNGAIMAKAYNLADVFILPSREDNLPNVMLESFACGTPVIAFSIGGMKEHINEQLNGSLAKEMNSDSLANAIEKFYINRTKYNRLNIREYALNQFSYEKQAGNYIQVYNKLMNE